MRLVLLSASSSTTLIRRTWTLTRSIDLLMNTTAPAKLSASQYLPFGVGLLPLVPVWLIVLVQYGGTPALPMVTVIGAVATVSALVLGFPVWRQLLRSGEDAFRRERW